MFSKGHWLHPGHAHDTRTGGEPGSAGQDRIQGQPGLAACGHSLTGPFPASPCSGRFCLNRCSLQRGWFKHQARRFPSNNHHFSHQDNHPSQAQGHGPLLDLPGAPSHGPQGDACLNSGWKPCPCSHQVQRAAQGLWWTGSGLSPPSWSQGSVAEAWSPSVLRPGQGVPPAAYSRSEETKQSTTINSLPAPALLPLNPIAISEARHRLKQKPHWCLEDGFGESRAHFRKSKQRKILNTIQGHNALLWAFMDFMYNFV